jgi:hypothetical protein
MGVGASRLVEKGKVESGLSRQKAEQIIGAALGTLPSKSAEKRRTRRLKSEIRLRQSKNDAHDLDQTTITRHVKGARKLEQLPPLSALDSLEASRAFNAALAKKRDGRKKLGPATKCIMDGVKSSALSIKRDGSARTKSLL